MKVCYWGTYDKNYSRNIILISGLRENGVEVVENHIQFWKGSRQKLSTASGNWLRFKFLWRLLLIYLRLSIRFFSLRKVDFLIIGYSGHFDVFVAKILTKVKKLPLAFDAFLSLYDSLVFDRKIIYKNSLKAKFLYLVDKYACRLSDIVFLDTNANINYFSKTFNLPKKKFRRIFIGANDQIFYPRPVKDKDYFLVLYFGNYIPLHGIEYIIKSAKILESETDIYFRFIGYGDQYQRAVKLVRKFNLQRIEFLPQLPPELLAQQIAQADICLGVFGATDKAKRVIPNKVYEALAMAKPVISGDSPACRELLENGKHCILCKMASPSSLAEKILLLKKNKKLREKIAQQGYRLFKTQATPQILGKELKEHLSSFNKR